MARPTRFVLAVSLLLTAYLTFAPPVLAEPTGFEWGISVATHPTALDRTSSIEPGSDIFVYVVTDRIGSGDHDPLRACQFAVTVDPRLEVIARYPTSEAGLAINRGVDEWLLGFSDCVFGSRDPFLLMT